MGRLRAQRHIVSPDLDTPLLTPVKDPTDPTIEQAYKMTRVYLMKKETPPKKTGEIMAKEIATSEKQRNALGFHQVGKANEIPLYVSTEGANALESANRMVEPKLKLATHQILLSALSSDSSLRGKFNENGTDSNFWIAGTGRDVNHLFREGEKSWMTKGTILCTFDQEGNLRRGKGNSIETTVRVWKGPDDNPLLFYVLRDGYARAGGARFVLGAWDKPDFVANLVVGVPQSN